ncbi:MAG: ATP-binding cassette domain-containing protein [Deltaproteobacteria bacterium]|nr:ATP-binding cassette domain-containing protein [Deltaproteobacteria bacterium]
MTSTVLVSIRNLVKYFDISGGWLEQLRFTGGRIVRQRDVVKAVNNVSFDINRGETVSVVGESGCGKSTLARTVMCLYPPNSGEIYYQGKRIDGLSEKHLKPYRTKMQMVFQDPYASLNPRMTVEKILKEPIRFHHPEMNRDMVEEKIIHVMKQVGIDPDWRDRHPHEFSGGQRQRISIARALTIDPDFIVADEPIAALDVSIQAQILNLLMELQQDNNLTYLFISHDLSVVRHISDKVAVMYLGTLCEFGETAQLFAGPQHPYTRALLSAIPKIGERFSHTRLQGDVPTPINLPPGCVFNTRCPHAKDVCLRHLPDLTRQQDGSFVACHGVAEGWLA